MRKKFGTKKNICKDAKNELLKISEQNRDELKVMMSIHLRTLFSQFNVDDDIIKSLIENMCKKTKLVGRPMDVTFGHKTERVGKTDLIRSYNRKNSLVTWWSRGRTRRTDRKLINPSFAIIQSSGMGKSKLMYHYKKRIIQEENYELIGVVVVNFLCEREGKAQTGNDFQLNNTEVVHDCKIHPMTNIKTIFTKLTSKNS